MFDDLEVIRKYFDVSDSINRLKKQKEQASYIFYSQNMATKMDYTEHGVQTTAFRIEKRAIEFIMSLECKVCQKKNDALWYQNNRKRILEDKKEYYQKNKEQIKKRQLEYHHSKKSSL